MRSADAGLGGSVGNGSQSQSRQHRQWARSRTARPVRGARPQGADPVCVHRQCLPPDSCTPPLPLSESPSTPCQSLPLSSEPIPPFRGSPASQVPPARDVGDQEAEHGGAFLGRGHVFLRHVLESRGSPIHQGAGGSAHFCSGGQCCRPHRGRISHRVLTARDSKCSG